MIGAVVVGAGGVAALLGAGLLRAVAHQKKALAAVLGSSRKAIAEAKDGDRVHLQGFVRLVDDGVQTPIGERAAFTRLVAHTYDRDLMSGQNDERGRWTPLVAEQRCAQRFVVKDDTGAVDVDVEAARFLVGPEFAKTWSTAPGGTPPPASLLAFLEEKKVDVHSKRTGGLRTMKVFLERLVDGDIVDAYGVIVDGKLSAKGGVPLVIATSAQVAAKRADLPMLAARKLGATLMLGGAVGLAAGAVLLLLA